MDDISNQKPAGPPDLSTNTQHSFLRVELANETAKLKNENLWRSGRISRVLLKYGPFRVVLMIMRSGAIFEQHKSEGRISVQVLTGHLRMQIGDTRMDLPAGHLVALERNILHNVHAVEESSFLLTISLPEGSS